MTARARAATTRTRSVPRAKTAAPAPIDFGPLGKRLGYVMRRAQLAIFEDFIATCAQHDIRPGQYSALTIIDCNPGLSQTQVAAGLGIKTPNFVAMVDELEARGLVRRAALPQDRRRHALVLTPAGRKLTQSLHARAEAHEARIVARIGTEAHARMFGWLAAIAGLSDDHGHDIAATAARTRPSGNVGGKLR